MKFSIVAGYPDYHPEQPGGMPSGGRSMETQLFPFQQLGPWASKLRPRTRGQYMLVSESPLGGGTGQLDPEVVEQRRVLDERGTGQALVAGLLKGLLDLGVTPELGPVPFD